MSASTPSVECPAGICQTRVVTFDHDRMFGHLLAVHSWTFNTSQAWVVENMASDEEARELEAEFVNALAAEEPTEEAR